MLETTLSPALSISLIGPNSRRFDELASAKPKPQSLAIARSDIESPVGIRPRGLLFWRFWIPRRRRRSESANEPTHERPDRTTHEEVDGNRRTGPFSSIDTKRSRARSSRKGVRWKAFMRPIPGKSLIPKDGLWLCLNDGMGMKRGREELKKRGKSGGSGARDGGRTRTPCGCGF